MDFPFDRPRRRDNNVRLTCRQKKTTPKKRRSPTRRCTSCGGPASIVAGVLVVIGILLALGWHKQVSLESLVRHRAMLAALVAAHPFMALACFVAFYALAAGMALPGVIFLTIGGGALFGGLVGGVLAMIGATAGATGVFLIGKTLLRQAAMHWLGPQVRRFAEGFRHGAFNYLLFMRLVPVFPFTLGNLLPALCGMRIGPFVLATFFGIAPMTLAIAFFGAGLDSALGRRDRALSRLPRRRRRRMPSRLQHLDGGDAAVHRRAGWRWAWRRCCRR